MGHEPVWHMLAQRDRPHRLHRGTEQSLAIIENGRLRDIRWRKTDSKLCLRT